MEEQNVTQLPEKPPEKPPENETSAPPQAPPDPRYAVREPTISDAVALAGILAEGADNPQVFDAIDSKQNSAAMLFLFTGALRNSQARNGLLYLLADLWVKDVPDGAVEKPHDDWIYEASAAQIKNGTPPRDERWRMISRKNRKRMVKQFEIGELPFSALMEFGRNLAALESIESFLESVQKLMPEDSESSSTESKDDTQSGVTVE